MKEPPIRIPPLISGGLMLTYRCTNSCRHCLYRCSPKMPDEWMSTRMARRALEALRDEPQLTGIHISGGEATLNIQLLEQVITLAGQLGVPVDYLETNAFWCLTDSATRERFERLQRAGLTGVLVSVSLFHNEWVPFRRTRNCIQAARAVFGQSSVFVYLPHMYSMLQQLPDDRTHSLEQLCAALGLEADDPRIPAMYGVIPSGRACSALRACYRSKAAEAFENQSCFGDLTSTSHFHIDPHGHLFTGLCAGMVAATVDDLHAEITKTSRPVFTTLCRQGPYGLMQLAVSEHGYEPRHSGYVSHCDLCLDVRDHLWRSGLYPELQPAAFYSGS